MCFKREIKEQEEALKAIAREVGSIQYLSNHNCRLTHEPIFRFVSTGSCVECDRLSKLNHARKTRTKPGFQAKRRVRDAELESLNPELKQRRLARGKNWQQNNVGKKLALNAARKAAKIQRTPPWVDMGKIEQVYDSVAQLNAPKAAQYHVDHIVPLRGENVSGLHVHWNLRAALALENISKGNRVDLDNLTDCIDLTAEYYTKGWIPV